MFNHSSQALRKYRNVSSGQKLGAIVGATNPKKQGRFYFVTKRPSNLKWYSLRYHTFPWFKGIQNKCTNKQKKHSWTPYKYFPLRKRKFCLKSEVASLSDWRRGPSGQVFFVMKSLLPVGGAIEKCLNDRLMNICFLRASICLCLLLDYLQSVEFPC